MGNDLTNWEIPSAEGTRNPGNQTDNWDFFNKTSEDPGQTPSDPAVGLVTSVEGDTVKVSLDRDSVTAGTLLKAGEGLLVVVKVMHTPNRKLEAYSDLSPREIKEFLPDIYEAELGAECFVLKGPVRARDRVYVATDRDVVEAHRCEEELCIPYFYRLLNLCPHTLLSVLKRLAQLVEGEDRLVVDALMSEVTARIMGL